MSAPEQYPYQRQGSLWLAPRARAYLADGMGLGKTGQALVAAKALGAKRILVVCPASVAGNWRAEGRLWEVPGVVPVSYSMLAAHLGRYRAYYLHKAWDVVILDEAHYVKTPDAVRTHRALKLAQAAPVSWLLSGTPMPNHPGELFAPIAALWPARVRALGLSDHGEWFNHFTRWRNTRYGRRPYGTRNASDLVAILRDVMLRRKLADVGLELPPLRVDLHRIPRDRRLDAAIAELGIDATDLRARLEAEEGDSDGSLSRLRRLLGSYKAPLIGRILADELRDGAYAKLVVMYYHRDTGGILREALREFGVVGFDGSTPGRQRDAAVERFDADPGVRVFVAQQTAAQEGINLQAASEAVLVEPSWTPGGNAQAIKRIHRIGQRAQCRARIFVVEGTLDEAVMETNAVKVRMQLNVNLD